MADHKQLNKLIKHLNEREHSPTTQLPKDFDYLEYKFDGKSYIISSSQDYLTISDPVKNQFMWEVKAWYRLGDTAELRTIRQWEEIRL